MEELIGRRVKLTLTNTQGYVVLTGEVLRIDSPFLLIQTVTGTIYVAMHGIKFIELA